jgi:serine protease Do
VLVADVDADSPAARAGFQSGDVILAFNGTEVHSAQDLSLAVAEAKAGTPAKVQVLRNGRQLTLDVKLGERPQDIAEKLPPSEAERHARLGIKVEDLTPDAARAMSLASTKGVLVTEVTPGSPADDGGVQAGDVIREINHVPVSNANELMAIVHNLKSSSNVLMKVERQGQILFLAFELS